MGGIIVNESAYGQPNTAIAFSHKAIYVGESICGDGVAAKTVAVPGVLATDIVIVSWLINSLSNYLLTVIPAANAFTITASGATAVTDKVHYMVLRAC